MNSEAAAIARARGLVGGRVDHLVAGLSARDAGVLERLRYDAIEELSRWKDLTLVPLDTAPPTSCSIAGVYLPDENPPRIGLWRQMSRPRAMFTALHELGHHLQQTSGELVDALDGEPDQGAYLEERTSDAFAARILLPSDLVARALGAGTPTADKVADLWAQAGVSRAAACVAAAQQLSSPGHVVLMDGDFVQFSSSFGELPLRRGSDQSSSAIMRARRQMATRVTVVSENRFSYRDGIEGTPLYAQAADMGGYTVVVAVAYRAPWAAISLPSSSSTIAAKWQTCGRCDRIFQVWGQRCAACGAGYCPDCGKCDCETRVVERTCLECFLMKPAQLFTGDSRVCDDCMP
ncbi:MULTISPECIES: ImmA/IrrE family metallo-endopeptidase [Microbacterium]|uniref:ImmA/IrrE family metallo-endopeptidase n=1 Tax=Microbacterium TaxID=33882 RepID=UPI0009E20B4E|nr:ImmA/IrrE family metallo-endopeptidase [Microbacterium sp. MEJ108Y]